MQNQPFIFTQGEVTLMAKPKNSIAEYRSYYLQSDFPVLLLSGDHWKISNIPSKNLHFHNCLEIGICHSESGYMEFNGQQEPLLFKEGDITCIPRNIPHTTYSSPNTESHWSYLFIDPQELFKNVAPNLSHSFDLSLSAYKDYKHILSRENYPQVYNLTMSIIKEMEEKKPHYQASTMGLLLALCIELHRVQSEGGGETTLTDKPPENAMVISPVLDYIEDHYSEQFDMDYLADICRLSPTHFRRLFHSIMGTSPLEFLNTTRITKACNLLRSTEYSILEISERVGFRSVSSFNRHFMETMQTTPRNYRNETLFTKESQEKLSIKEFTGWMYPEK